jgi:hypothetical protein
MGRQLQAQDQAGENCREISPGQVQCRFQSHQRRFQQGKIVDMHNSICLLWHICNMRGVLNVENTFFYFNLTIIILMVSSISN